MKVFKNLALIILFLVASCGYTFSQYQPSAENLKNREWFDKSKLGVFIHWGVYSVLGNGEWVMNNQKIGVEEYNLLPSFFNPIDFNAKEWASLFKKSGAKYITFTSRHHDGFSMWDSKTSDYNIVQKTPFKRDIVKELVEACRAEGIKVMFYYSLLDWHRDDYLPAAKTGKDIPGRDTTKGNWNSYIQFMKNQLTELLTNYGQIDGIWFDGHWDKPNADWKYDEIYSLIHKLQPQCLVGNNHHLAPFEGEDFQLFERDLPGQNLTGFGTKAEDVGSLPMEVCGTIAGSWGFDIKDRKRKSFQEVLGYLLKAAGHGSNLLLNVGPMPNGQIQDYQQERLLQVGEWLKVYGEAVYETKKGFVTPTGDYAVTKKDKIYYVHIINPQLKSVEFENIDFEPKGISSFDGKEKIKYQVKDNKLTLDLSNQKFDNPYVIKIQLK